MAFDVPEAFASDVELTPGCFLGLLHEDMEHGDRPADTHGLGVRRPELGTVIFEEVEQLNSFSARRLRLFRSIRLHIAPADPRASIRCPREHECCSTQPETALPS